jgi:2-keto-3-deoxy-L-rhamnonate aldolase RhmA
VQRHPGGHRHRARRPARRRACWRWTPREAQRYLDAGALFVAVGVDTSMLVQNARERLALFKKT